MSAEPRSTFDYPICSNSGVRGYQECDLAYSYQAQVLQTWLPEDIAKYAGIKNSISQGFAVLEREEAVYVPESAGWRILLVWAALVYRPRTELASEYQALVARTFQRPQ